MTETPTTVTIDLPIYTRLDGKEIELGVAQIPITIGFVPPVKPTHLPGHR